MSLITDHWLLDKSYEYIILCIIAWFHMYKLSLWCECLTPSGREERPRHFAAWSPLPAFGSQTLTPQVQFIYTHMTSSVFLSIRSLSRIGIVNLYDNWTRQLKWRSQMCIKLETMFVWYPITKLSELSWVSASPGQRWEASGFALGFPSLARGGTQLNSTH